MKNFTIVNYYPDTLEKEINEICDRVNEENIKIQKINNIIDKITNVVFPICFIILVACCMYGIITFFSLRAFENIISYVRDNMTYTIFHEEVTIFLLLGFAAAILFILTLLALIIVPDPELPEKHFTPAMRLHSSIKGKEIISTSLNNYNDLKLTLEDENHIISHYCLVYFNYLQKTNIDKIEIDVGNATVYTPYYSTDRDFNPYKYIEDEEISHEY